MITYAERRRGRVQSFDSAFSIFQIAGKTALLEWGLPKDGHNNFN
jgi:hypothetical protein